MSPERKQELKYNLVIIILTGLVSFGTAWGATMHRVSTIERDIADAMRRINDFQNVAVRLEIAAGRMEQIAMDYDRRISRLEDGR
jgi:hypothetical protein